MDLEYPYGNSEQVNEQVWLDGVEQLLQIAEEENIRYQFFVLGRTAEEYPSLIRRISDAGHGVACHSYEHVDQTELNYEEKLFQVTKCKEIVEEVTGEQVIGNRFPYSSWDVDSFRALKEAGYRYDSSVWEHEEFEPYIKEFKISNVYDDWTFYIHWNKTDAEMYKQIVKNTQTKDHTVIVHHPWVLTQDPERMELFEVFAEEIQKIVDIKTMDELVDH